MGQNSSSSIKNYIVNIQTKDRKFFQISYHSLVEHILLLRHVIKHQEMTKEGPMLDFFIRDYCQRMIDGEMKTEEQQSRIPWQTDWIWHIHRLHPLHYLNDCKKQLRDGIVQKKTINFIQNHLEKENFKTNFSSPKSYFLFDPFVDLRKAIIQQNEFLKKFQKHRFYSYDFQQVNELQFQNLVQDYVSFVKLAKKNEMIVPTFDIDLIWHTHMRYPSDYQEFSLALCGFILDHDDAIESSTLTNAYQRTADQWKERYQSEYGKNVERKHLETSLYLSSCAMISNPVSVSSATKKQSDSASPSGCGSSWAYIFNMRGNENTSGDGGDSGDGGGCGGGGCGGD